ncbi:salicylate hydroxylase [Xylariaceae sp. AK1471]|nr:salicylate hydroxylase [Xylariaceae sp. AK1471]
MSNYALDDQINVIVIGAGLGGCACALALKHHGHSVIIYERLRVFRRLGDSLGLGENALKLLARWGGRGLYDRLTSIGNQAPDMQIRRWHDGKILAVQPLMDMAGYIGHRGDYHTAFLDAVQDAGIEIRMGCEAVSYQDEEGSRPAIILADGTKAVADLIVGADGIKSRARELVLGFADAPKSSGYSCYRAYFPGKHLKEDPLCREFVDHDCVNIWYEEPRLDDKFWFPMRGRANGIGEDTHLVQNTLRNGDEFNWIVTRKLSHEADMEIRESWFQEGDLEDVARVTATVDPRIRAAVAKTPSCLDWKICYRDPLPTWVSPRSHCIALLGDSCHPHLPTSAQGASQATESAAVLAVCLKLAGKEKIPLATRTYEKLRFARTRASQTNGEDLRDRWHNALKDVDDGVEIDPESLKIRNRWLYAFDAEADTLERWEEVSSLVSQELQIGNITPLC